MEIGGVHSKTTPATPSKRCKILSNIMNLTARLAVNGNPPVYLDHDVGIVNVVRAHCAVKHTFLLTRAFTEPPLKKIPSVGQACGRVRIWKNFSVFRTTEREVSAQHVEKNVD